MNDQHDASGSIQEELEQLVQTDHFVQSLGLTMEKATTGVVKLAMKVRQRHLSFNGTCHGGVLFSVADTAFGLASNSHGVIAVGIHADIAYCVPAVAGDRLTIEAREVSRSRRVGTYIVDISNQEGATVAVFTGTVHRTQRSRQA